MNRLALAYVALVGSYFLLPGPLKADTIVKHWSGTATVHGQKVPVRLDLSQVAKDGKLSGGYLNGNEYSASSSGMLNGAHLVLQFDYFARKLEGELTADKFTGTYGGKTGTPMPIELHPETENKETTKAGPSIKGEWEIAVHSSKGESAWTLRVSPFKSNEIEAVILRIDGDTGGLYGSFDEKSGEYRVGHFAASGPALYSLKPQSDGSLIVTNLLRDGQQWLAQRPGEARKKNLVPPTKETEQTGIVDPSKPLTFSAISLSGETVSNTDARFRGKVVIVAIGGSWCPNCHDEAPFLVELYKHYHSRGLEIVDISFEEEDQLKDPQRLHAFVAKYHIPYLVLLGGTPDEVNAKLPQGKNLNCWPTTFFVGRAGLVRETHAGFSGPDTGTANEELKDKTDRLVERLLAEGNVAQR
ncbi:TlpA disulfide reductase family protein [Acidobacterium sp. S8]|uniref:TlpA disulfide reductase family protein n=1 Tax=Acidobacterium sp. S8 TaxID=1641854 RepID=UPI00131EBE38|nr:TlpA disulfide reductase family protein [Acidobacterium sp. S8]